MAKKRSKRKSVSKSGCVTLVKLKKKWKPGKKIFQKSGRFKRNPYLTRKQVRALDIPAFDIAQSVGIRKSICKQRKIFASR